MTPVAVTQAEREEYLRALRDESEARAKVQVFERELEHRKGIHRKTRAHLSGLDPADEVGVSADEVEEVQRSYSRAIATFEEFLEGLGGEAGGSAHPGADGNRRSAMRRARHAKLSQCRRERSRSGSEVHAVEHRRGDADVHDSVLTRDTDTGELRVYDVINGEG